MLKMLIKLLTFSENKIIYGYYKDPSFQKDASGLRFQLQINIGLLNSKLVCENWF